MIDVQHLIKIKRLKRIKKINNQNEYLVNDQERKLYLSD
jgi:hypothetical protein